MAHNFKELKIWNKSMTLVVEVYQLTKNLPSEERYGLISQITRCAVSVPSNIAESCSRESGKDRRRFINIALGSAFELETQLLLIKSIYTNQLKNCNTLVSQVNELQRMINGYKGSIKI